MKRPDLLRSWSTDVIGIFDAEYVWHDLAQLWQTPGAGEEAVEAWASESVDERAARLQTFGITPDVAIKLAQGVRQDDGQLHPDALSIGHGSSLTT